MRRLSQKTKARLVRKQQWVLKQWAKIHRAVACAIYKNKKKKRARAKRPYIPAVRYRAPAAVTIEHPLYRSQLLAFLEQIREHFKNKQNRTLLIDFSKTENFVSAGTLLLYAELNRLIAYSSGAVKLRCTEPANDRSSQVLKQVGIYRLCSNNSSVKTNRSDVVHWQVAQGQLVDNSLCAPAIEGYQDRLETEMIDELLGGLGEAMTNAIHHAYDSIRQDGLDYKGTTDWWMFSQEKEGRLSVVICDLGIGIPTTLPLKRPNIWQKLILRKPTPTDSDCIREAIVEGHTRTSLDGRGYGLGNIVDVVENTMGGVVVVYSNHGRYDSRSVTPYPLDYDDSIMGTMIFWNVPMKSKSKSKSKLNRSS